MFGNSNVHPVCRLVGAALLPEWTLHIAVQQWMVALMNVRPGKWQQVDEEGIKQYLAAL